MTGYSSKELLGKMRSCIDSIETELRDNRLSADVQIDDVNLLCWAMVEIAVRLQGAIRDELSDLEGG